ncbi:MAG: CHAP domain-containing protein [Ruminococcus sp.]|nr:CHAP domain-containing protein [Ruminococcus sp.]
MNYDSFFQKYNGRPIDFDGTAGVQCVDLVDLYLKEVYGITGVWVQGARELYTRFYSFPALVKAFDRISNTRSLIVKKGDIIVWGGGRFGHTGIGSGKGTLDWFESFEQNTRGRHEPAQLVQHRFSPTDGCYPVLGVLRPKEKNENSSAKRVRVTYRTGLNIRRGAGIGNEIVGLIPCGSEAAISDENKVGGQMWGKLTDGAGWICLTGFTEEIK